MSEELFGMAPHDPGGRSKIPWPAGSIIQAEFGGPRECYRYSLFESWDLDKPVVGFLLHNPSIASTLFADPTLIRTGNYARRWGYGAQVIVNVFAYRATDPQHLLTVDDPVGPGNENAIDQLAYRAKLVIVAHGQFPPRLRARAQWAVQRLLTLGADLGVLERSKNGEPKHPLYLRGDLTPSQF